MQRTKDVESQVEDLVTSANHLDIRLHNTFNQFLMLSDTQFVENVCDFYLLLLFFCFVFQFIFFFVFSKRVYDEDVAGAETNADGTPTTASSAAAAAAAAASSSTANGTNDESDVLAQLTEAVLVPKYTLALAMGLHAVDMYVNSVDASTLDATGRIPPTTVVEDEEAEALAVETPKGESDR